MVRIIGKLLLLILLGINLDGCEFGVKLFSYNGEQINQVTVGVPFQLHMIAKGDCELDEVKLGTSFEVCNLSSLGVVKSINNINGVTTRAITHKYLARIDRPGVYQLGPVQFWQAGKLYASKDLEIKVSEPQELSSDLKNKPVVILKTSQEQPYLGEQFVLDVKFYLTHNQAIIPKLIMPAGLENNFDLTLIAGPVKGVEQHNGIQVSYWQWQIGALAKKAGQLIIPAVSVSFVKESQHNNFFMFAGYDQATLFSNVLKLNVRNLPPTNQTVHGIGQFTSFTAHLDRGLLDGNQAAQLILKLVGSGNWSQIEIPELTGLQDQLQVYAGKALQEDNCKKFEFILQGVKSGRVQIPAQAFCYFDTQLGKYQTLYTQPLDLEVLAIKQDLPLGQNLNQENLTRLNQLDLNMIQPIMQTGVVSHQSNYYLPIYLWLGIIYGLVLVLGLVFLRKFYKSLNILILIFVFNGYLLGNSQESFLKAGELYKTGEFSKAQVIYESISCEAKRGAVVWYNLGNCYFEQANYVGAINAWLHAGKIGNKQVVCNSLSNIKVAQEKLSLVAPANYLPDFFVRVWLLENNFLGLQLLFLLILIGLFISLFKWFKHAKLIWSLIILELSMITGIAILCAKENNLRYAVVQNSATLLAGPACDYHNLAQIAPGQIFKIVQQVDSFCRVENGWLANNDIHIV